MSTKAVHLEMVPDLSTDVFLATFDRFVVCRSISINLYTDCGNNFVGAAKQLNGLFDSVNNKPAFINNVPCQWHFNPPRLPHFGEGRQ